MACHSSFPTLSVHKRGPGLLKLALLAQAQVLQEAQYMLPTSAVVCCDDQGFVCSIFVDNLDKAQAWHGKACARKCPPSCGHAFEFCTALTPR